MLLTSLIHCLCPIEQPGRAALFIPPLRRERLLMFVASLHSAVSQHSQRNESPAKLPAQRKEASHHEGFSFLAPVSPLYMSDVSPLLSSR